MALEYVKRVFSKVGRGIPQVQQVDDDNQPLTDPKTGAPITGNEQYWADQLVSVPYTKGEGEEAEEDAETFILNALEATKGDLKLVASCFLDGFNKHLRLTAGGLDEYQKAARKLMKSGLEAFAGQSEEDIAEWLKTVKMKQSSQ